MSYIWTKAGWFFLAIVMGLYSRRIVGRSAGPRMKTALPLDDLNRAIALRRPLPGLMHHSDRGSQYCAYEYRYRLKDIGAIASISGKGNCYDNVVVETFFKTLKSELVWCMTFHTRRQALSEIGQCIAAKTYALVSQSIPMRLHCELISLWEAHPSGGLDNVIIFEPAPNFSEQAKRINTYREHVSREVSVPARMGLNQRTQDYLKILDLQGLRDVCPE